jgi:hypothetical protein
MPFIIRCSKNRFKKIEAVQIEGEVIYRCADTKCPYYFNCQIKIKTPTSSTFPKFIKKEKT